MVRPLPRPEKDCQFLLEFLEYRQMHRKKWSSSWCFSGPFGTPRDISPELGASPPCAFLRMTFVTSSRPRTKREHYKERLADCNNDFCKSCMAGINPDNAGGVRRSFPPGQRSSLCRRPFRRRAVVAI